MGSVDEHGEYHMTIDEKPSYGIRMVFTHHLKSKHDASEVEIARAWNTMMNWPAPPIERMQAERWSLEQLADWVRSDARAALSAVRNP